MDGENSRAGPCTRVDVGFWHNAATSSAPNLPVSSPKQLATAAACVVQTIMTDPIAILARYNRHVNNLLFDLLDGIDDDLILRRTDAYFGSILGILNHILLSNLGWLVRIRDGGVDLPALADKRLDFTDPGFGNLLYTSYPPVRDHQRAVDDIFLAFTAQIEADSVFEYTRDDGDTVRYRARDIMLHIMNHATHHRGQISQILDSYGVDHDYSNLRPTLDQA